MFYSLHSGTSTALEFAHFWCSAILQYPKVRADAFNKLMAQAEVTAAVPRGVRLLGCPPTV